MFKKEKTFLYLTTLNKTEGEIRNALKIISIDLKGLRIDHRISHDRIENRITYELILLTIITNVHLTKVEITLMEMEQKTQTMLLVKFRYELKSTTIFKKLHFYVVGNQYLRAILIRHIYRFKKDITKWL